MLNAAACGRAEPTDHGDAINLQRFPRYPLTFGPTPIQPLERLSDHLGGKVQLYAKREDCNSGFAFGGNKTRKLEYLIPEALAQGCDTLVSIGGIQSNQTRQVAAVAAHLGMKCVLVQENWVNYSDAVYDRVGNIQMSRILGADVRLVPDGFDIGFRKSWEDALESVRAAGGKPYAIPAGCSDHPLGGLGFVGFAEEVRQQEAELGFRFDYIVVCSVTGSTQAGMVVGFAADGRADRVIGIDASAKPAQTREQITRIARHTAEQVGLGRDITAQDVVLDERFGGPEYGLPNEGTLQAIRLCARLEGVLTDPVYEGKSMHGMIDMVRNGEFPEGSRVLYAHLGGVPALNGYSFIFRDG
ncbi:1-aminocyclopropane-1-carboxylate deaminase [Paraburkholderia rhynchosiae]|uniref:1-aminocyclopropane-1-carboxylate deaminase n=1 Tax=Paraburkholderia rhynchosiae TaxID=487049 RepID=A0A6J5B751_9BURK|nr:1-aminocyclopropane-1-carboxylate deaminase [Paraburkholderia rhynchosiae]